MVHVQYVLPKMSDLQKRTLIDRLTKKIDRLERVWKHRSAEPHLLIKVDVIRRVFFQVSLELTKVGKQDVFIKRQSDRLFQALELAYTDFKEAVLKKSHLDQRFAVSDRNFI